MQDKTHFTSLFKIVFIGMLLLLSTALSGQSSDVTALLDKGYELESVNPDRAIGIYKEAIELSTFSHDDLSQGRALSYIGLVFMSQGEYDSLYFYSDYALKKFEKIEYNQGIASINNNLANSYLYQGFYTQALNYYQKALPYYEQDGQEYNLTVILNNIASMFQHNEDHLQSNKHLQRALIIAMQLEDDHTLATTYNNISASYTSTGNISKAYNYSDSAWQYILKTDDDHLKVIIGSNLARAGIGTNKLSVAYEVLDNIKTIHGTSEDLENDIVINQTEALYQQAIGNHEKAIEYAKFSLKDLQEFKDKSFEIDVLTLLRDSYSQMGNTKQALLYANKLDTVKSQSFLASRNKQVSELEAIYQNAANENIINTQNIQLEKQSGQRKLLIGVTSILLLLSFFGIYFYKERKNKIEQTLQLQNEKVSNLEKQQKLAALDYIVQGQEEERKRIAQDLHDGLGGLLTSVRRQISNIQDEIKKLTNLNFADDAERMIAEACDEVRRISHDMMPASLVSLGLQDAIEDLIEDISSNSNLKVTSTLEDCQYATGDKEKVNIYRIIQEIFTNVVKHAAASSIDIAISKVDDQIRIQIKDDGQGAEIEKLKSSNGMGLQNIKARVNYLGGHLEVITRPQEGVSYQITLPFSTSN